MLTPAEETGLAGAGLMARVRRAMHQIPEGDLRAILGRIEEAARREHLVYFRDGREEVLRLLPMPLTVMPDQVAYCQSVTISIHLALKRLFDLHALDPDVRAVLRLPDAEEEWLRACRPPSLADSNPVFGRHDAVVDFARSDWKSSLQFVEPNMSGIGGLHLVPTSERVLAELVLPELHRRDPALQLERGTDIREILMQEVVDHLEAIGRPARRICFVEPMYSGDGPDEQEALARFVHDRYGIEVSHADPSELELQGDEVLHRGCVVDVAYRDDAVQDLIALAEQGVDVRPMRALLAQNRMISSIASDLDQKACWEVFTDPELAARHFSADARQVFRRHVPWTRVIADRRTTLPDGTSGALLPFVREHREELVMKPNRAFGGHGVTVGRASTASEWDARLDEAVEDPARWVVQRWVEIPVHDFPVLDADGHVHAEPFYAVMGLAPSRYGLAILGRASQKQVVNIANRGGLCAVFVGHPPGRIVL